MLRRCFIKPYPTFYFRGGFATYICFGTESPSVFIFILDRSVVGSSGYRIPNDSRETSGSGAVIKPSLLTKSSTCGAGYSWLFVSTAGSLLKTIGAG